MERRLQFETNDATDMFIEASQRIVENCRGETISQVPRPNILHRKTRLYLDERLAKEGLSV